ncbi:MAG: hypothetical protein EA358_09990, partial [Flavobacteriales bacterium]
FLSPKRAFFRFGGKAHQEKVSFLVQTNFSDRSPLYDAWIAYHPTKHWTIYMGQRQTFANNLEMRFREDRLQFTERGLISEQLSMTGREFGLFVEGAFGEKFGFSPMLAITSGDGRNSFGVDSRDTDLGGLKYAARVDLFPLGHFTPGNELHSADLARESSPKVLVGAAYSYNNGASGRTGEGHGDFLLFNENGEQSLPNYRQLYIDLMAKYQGFSYLFEFGNASATGVRDRFLDAEALRGLTPGQISSLLALGNSLNTQLGYVTKSGYSFDLRYGRGNPEFALITQSQLADIENFTLGFTKYFRGHNLKIQTAYSLLTATSGNRQVLEIMMQFGF